MSSEQLTVLVADDSRVILKAFSRIMSDHYNLVEAADGKQAWDALIENNEICAVFSDWEMPEMDGIELARKMRSSKNPRIRSTPVIMVTSKSDDESTKELAYAAGATDFIAKPFDATELLARAKANVKAIDATGEAEDDKAVMNPQNRIGNRQYFQQQAIQMLSFANRANIPMAMMLVSIDKIGEIVKKTAASEQQYGEFFLEVATNISEVLRKDDSIAIVSKTIIGVLLSSSDMAQAQAIAKKLLAISTNLNLQLNAQKVPISFSIGIEVSEPNRQRQMQGMLKTAHERLMQALKSGKMIRPLLKTDSGLLKLDSIDKALSLVANHQGAKLDYVYVCKRLLPLFVSMDKVHNSALSKQLLPIIKGQKPRK